MVFLNQRENSRDAFGRFSFEDRSGLKYDFVIDYISNVNLDFCILVRLRACHKSFQIFISLLKCW